MRIIFALLAGLVTFTCGKQVTEVAPEAPPTRRELTRNAMRAAVWQFVYCVDPEQDASKLVSFLEGLAEDKPFGKRIEVVNCTDISIDSLGSKSFSLFGNRMPAEAFALPIEGDQLLSRHALKTDDVVFIPYFPNPWSKGRAVTAFYWSQEPDKIVEVLRSELDGNWDGLFWPRWAYELHRANSDRIYGSFADASWAFDHEKEVALQSPTIPVYDTLGLQIFAYDGAIHNQEIDLVSKSIHRLREVINTTFPGEATTIPEVRIYPNLERIGLRHGSMAPVQYDAKKKILHLVPCFLTEANILTSFPIWQSMLSKWARTEQQGDNLRKAMASKQHQASAALGQAYQDRLVEAFRAESTGILSRPDQEDPSSFILEAKARIAAVQQGPTPRIAPMTKRPAPNGKLAGMTFAHEGYRIHNGYGGEKIKPSMDSLGELNVNALAVVPYTFMRDPKKPTSLFIPSRAGQENDWATICSAREAMHRNWFVLLKPQIWVGGGYWPGSVEFESEEDWDTFFDNYTYWILHYAMLAEREQIGGLCLGTELVKTTIHYPERWREIIAKVRKVYGGQLTYAANWGEEFENFSFWDDLDAIGLNSYYPLAEEEQPTDEELLAGANRWLKMATKVSRQENRPLWLTEVGYRSIKAPWQHPHAEAGDRDSSLVDQARCYRALWTAAGNHPELEGAFIWKWPSYIGYGGGRRPYRRFTPGGKPAAQELAKFYGSWR